jgi:hypothetical protein
MAWEQEIKEAQDESSLKEKMRNQFLMIESYRDFMEWLFDISEHCNHITQTEAWIEFENYQANKK